MKRIDLVRHLDDMVANLCERGNNIRSTLTAERENPPQSRDIERSPLEPLEAFVEPLIFHCLLLRQVTE